MSKLHKICKRVRAYCVKNWYVEDLCGMCGRASVILYRALKKAGYRVRIACNRSHAFLTYGDYVIDITASQFGHDDIVIAPKREMDKNWWSISNLFETDKEFIAHQLDVGWPSEQIFGRRY